MFDAEDLGRVPGVAADTLQVVQVVLVEDLEEERQQNELDWQMFSIKVEGSYSRR